MTREAFFLDGLREEAGLTMRMRWIAMLALLAGLALGGCRQEFTEENYDTIYLGEPAWHVEKRLGKPTVTNGDKWVYVNGMPYYEATIEFDADQRVLAKRWSYDRPDAQP